ncbi:MAG: DUF4013 domain-containing protein [Methanomicrobiales archaeon]|nr:DUF4013 domain-containing protein [Methanomicrobiales archaeon]
MNYGSMIGDSFEYTKDGLFGNWGKWFLLFISMVIFPLWGGYQWKIYRGESRMPPLEGWVGMFIDGIKLIIVGIVYFIIPTIVFVILGGLGIFMGAATNSMGAGLIGVFVGLIFLFIFSLIAMMGLIRFARTDSFGEAFNFSAIIAHIGEIGWVSYIIALIILWLVIVVAVVIFSIAVGIISLILLLIPLVGWILAILLEIVIAILIGPFVGVFTTRYITHIYDGARAPA